MRALLSDKRVYFAGHGAIGGMLSGIAYFVSPFEGALASWVVGGAFDGMAIATLLALGQARYLGRSFDGPRMRKALWLAGLGGAAGGLVAMCIGFPLAHLLGLDPQFGRLVG